MKLTIGLIFLCLLSLGNLSAEEQPSTLQTSRADVEAKPFEHEKKPEKTDSKKEKSPHKFTSTLSLVSDYRDRGISQTIRRPAVQGEFKYEHSSRFYFKTFASNVDGTGNFINNTSMEWDFYLGITGKLPSLPIEIDSGFEYYYYPGGKAPVFRNTSYNTIEFYAQFSYKKFNITFHQTLTDYFGVNSDNPPINWDTQRTTKPNGHSIGSPYIEANWEIPVMAKLSLTLHAGYQTIINYPQLNFLDWLVALTYKFEWFDASITYVATTAKRAFYNVPDHAFHPHRKNLGGPGVFAGISRAF